MGAGHSAAGSVAWAEIADGLPKPQMVSEFFSVHTAQFDLAPCFLERGNASTIFAAMEAADPSLTFASIVDLTQHVRAVVFFNR